MVSSKGVEPKIKFTGYKVKKLTYGMKIELEKPDFQAKYALTTDKKGAEIEISINFRGKYHQKGQLILAGQFSLAEDLNDEEIKMFVSQNGVAMLYPYARTIVSVITALDDSNVSVLPTLNFVDMLKRNNDE